MLNEKESILREASDLKVEVQDLNSKLEASRNQNKQMLMEQDKAKSELFLLQKKLQSLESEHLIERGSLQAEVETLQLKCKGLEQKIADMEENSFEMEDEANLGEFHIGSIPPDRLSQGSDSRGQRSRQVSGVIKSQVGGALAKRKSISSSRVVVEHEGGLNGSMIFGKSKNGERDEIRVGLKKAREEVEELKEKLKNEGKRCEVLKKRLEEKEREMEEVSMKLIEDNQKYTESMNELTDEVQELQGKLQQYKRQLKNQVLASTASKTSAVGAGGGKKEESSVMSGFMSLFK